MPAPAEKPQDAAPARPPKSYEEPLGKKKPPRREIELDLIRGLAILLVIDFHSPASFTAWLQRHPHTVFPVGIVGVSVFFVLSGFLVGGLLMKEWKVRSRVDGRRFLSRRGFKIWPQYYLFLLVNLISGHRSLHELIGNLLNVQNYMGGIAHTWSLAVEEHAYLLLTALLMVASKFRWRLRSLFLGIALTCVLVSVERFVLQHFGVNIFAATNTRIDGILLGVLLAMLFHFAPARFAQLRSLTPVWIAGLVVSSIFLATYLTPWYINVLKYDAMNLFAVSLFLLLYRPNPSKRRGPLYRLIAWVGLYSYGIYLWHVALAEPLRHFHAGHPALPYALINIIFFILSVAIGYVLTKLVELPMLRLRDRLAPSRVDSAVGPPAIVEAPPGAHAEL